MMEPYAIQQIKLTECRNLWKQRKCAHRKEFIQQVKTGSRDVFLLTVKEEYVAECDLIYDKPDYGTVPGKRLYLSQLIVRKEMRGNGYGKAISQYILDLAKKKGYKTIALGVNCDNIAALNLYKKLGFTVYEEAEDKDGRFYKMEKVL